MAFEEGSSSNSGQGAEEYTQDMTDFEESFSDTSSESDYEDDDPLVVGAGQRNRGVLDDETRARRRLANAELDQHFANLRSILPSSRRVSMSGFRNLY